MSAVKAVLLDIEGTVSSISFVRDVLFPYTLHALPQVLDEKWDTPEFAPYRNEFPTEFRDEREKFEAHVRDLTARDVKIAYLKGLQGYLWLTAYRSGNIKAPLYADVIRALPLWTSRGLKVYIYSSGSVLAQKLFFEYTDNEAQPDQRGYLSGYFDTVNAGVKWEKTSYEKICEETGILPHEWVFLTDNVKDLILEGQETAPSMVANSSSRPSPQNQKNASLAERQPFELKSGVGRHIFGLLALSAKY
ncbi:enolase-phosphatase E1 [Orbilia oligospora]|uniref:Enolase-phosphatase E1 n=1 Tax=Orbilia oligospora TaxID=2813651 RepID=A0A7C8QAD5_ORBOL|nr:enolase-phosphatase E1 [Orbilia oligospora]KAF3203367.1 enolase-phosphatase E1 [Orbilia oligospora]KAF3204256.1 enolase-phosphatase E1 [Orbilia oligospora]KAF3210649.1 enolase-phosphatase E1 [Orbilia oligospora]